MQRKQSCSETILPYGQAFISSVKDFCDLEGNPEVGRRQMHLDLEHSQLICRAGGIVLQKELS